MALLKGTDNLLAYASQAILPEMKVAPGLFDADRHGSASIFNPLAVRPERRRQLERIRRLGDSSFRRVCHAWATKMIPNFPLGIGDEDSLTGERLTIPALPLFNIPPLWLAWPGDIRRFSVWFDQLPFETVRRILNILYTNTIDWKFKLQEDIDDQILQHFLWTNDSLLKQSISGQSVVVVVQPPWILSYRDLEEFAECHSFPVCPYPADTALGLEGKFRLWGKVWDICDRECCPWFIVSTYEGWVFGAFSRGWTTGFVSQVYPFNSINPTIILYMTYWMACAMGCPDGWSIPILEEELMEHSGRDVSPVPPPSRYVPLTGLYYSNEGSEDSVSVNQDSRGRSFAVLGSTRVWSQTSAHEYDGSESIDGSGSTDGSYI